MSGTDALSRRHMKGLLPSFCHMPIHGSLQPKRGSSPKPIHASTLILDCQPRLERINVYGLKVTQYLVLCPLPRHNKKENSNL